MIIGLHGRKQSGKDTVGAYLVKNHSFERRAFADPLKRSMAALFDISVGDLERYKNDPMYAVKIFGYLGGGQSLRTFNFRQLLQRYGNEAHRDVIDEDIWIDRTLPIEGYYVGTNIVVTDLRFVNEAERIRHLKGYVVQIDRPTNEQDSHASEQPISKYLVDYILHNGDTLDDLYKNVEAMMQHFRRD